MSKSFVNNSYRLTNEQAEFLSKKGNASAYLRDLLDREMKKESEVHHELESDDSLLVSINYKTAMMVSMLNQMMKAFPDLDGLNWGKKNLSFEQNWSNTFKEASAHYKYLVEK